MHVCMQLKVTSPSVMALSPQLFPVALLPPLTKVFLEHLLGQLLEELSHTAVTLDLYCLEIPMWCALHLQTGAFYHSALVRENILHKCQVLNYSPRIDNSNVFLSINPICTCPRSTREFPCYIILIHIIYAVPILVVNKL